MAKVYCVLVFFCLCLHNIIVHCQFDFFPNQREDRRYETPFGFQNHLPRPSRIRHRLPGHLHLRPDRYRPGTSNDYDRFGRPYQNYQGNYPNYGEQHEYDQYNYPNNGNRPYYEMPVRFPSYPEEPKYYQNQPLVYNDQSQQSQVQEIANEVPEPVPENNGSNGDTVSEDYNNSMLFHPPNPVNPTLPPLTPSVPQSEPKPFNPVPTSENQELSAFYPITASESNTVFPPFNPVPGSELPSFPVPTSETKELTPLTPVPQSESKTEKSPFNQGFLPNPLPVSEPKELPMLTPVPFELKPEYSPFNPVSNNSKFTPVHTPESTELPPSTSAPPAASNTLPPLTPVPPSESRANFNFGSQGLFMETCDTVDGEIGTCLSIYDCEPYLTLLQQSKSNPAVVQVLRKAHCGFEGNNPKVCCPRPGFPTAPPPPPPTTTTTTSTAAPATEPAGKSISGDYISVFPEPPVCGSSNASLGRVVNGIPANLGDFPWMALLGYQNRKTREVRWLCGGSLISTKHILTAAHCIHGHEVDLYVVRLGELDLAREDDGATPMDFLIKSKIKHESYNANAFTNDIGILVLERDVTFTEQIKPICIPRDSELRARSYENFNPLIAGWGDTEFRGPSATHLQVLQLPVVSNEYCAQAYSAYKAQTIDERVLCAGFKKGGKDACQGDSGGPLMQPIWNSEDFKTFFYQIGVVSFGKKCAEAGFPGVYTRVTQFVPWLEEKLLGSA